MIGISMDPFYYQSSISSFLEGDDEEVLSQLAKADDHAEIKSTQRDVWVDEIVILKEQLSGVDGNILFEYSIPRLGKRIDVVLIVGGVVFVLEFKGGDSTVSKSAIDQVWDYALDLKFFHEGSVSAPIVPVLIPFGVKSSDLRFDKSKYHDEVYEPVVIRRTEVRSTIQKFSELEKSAEKIDADKWRKSRYSPTPTIIQAATELYKGHNVKAITRKGATGDSLNRTTEAVLSVIREAKANRGKCICFVTGVPGAGKTLIGLNVAIQQNAIAKDVKEDKAVYLSGNQPLVAVLSEALARDKYNREITTSGKIVKRGRGKRGHGYTLTEARTAIHSFIQIVHHYRKVMLAKLKMPIKGTVEIDRNKCVYDDKDGYAEVDRIAIFDEAQRAWTQQELARWLKQKKHIANFPMSEPEFLIWSLDQHPGWSVIVCLVGGGQEINRGEAGISEWLKALATKQFSGWTVYYPEELASREFSDDDTVSCLKKIKEKRPCKNLHLTATMRSFRAKGLSTFVQAMLDCNIKEAKKAYSEISADGYPIVLTRDLGKAKVWLREHCRGSQRYGLMVSSGAYRLRPLAVDVRAKPSVTHWFLDDIKDIRSSLFMEDVATEFDVQGLELDWSGVIWDGDMIYDDKGWIQRRFQGNMWKRNADAWNRKYQLNAYRVLLTRARQGMVICIPNGDEDDSTRLPKFYNPTFEYLKSLGLEIID
jgi:hypothetical protein